MASARRRWCSADVCPRRSATRPGDAGPRRPHQGILAASNRKRRGTSWAGTSSQRSWVELPRSGTCIDSRATADFWPIISCYRTIGGANNPRPNRAQPPSGRAAGRPTGGLWTTVGKPTPTGSRLPARASAGVPSRRAGASPVLVPGRVGMAAARPGREGFGFFGRSQRRMSVPSASYSITMRVHIGSDTLAMGRITTAVGEAAGAVAAVDIVESHPDRLVVDLTVNASDARHAQAVTDAVEAVPGAHVHKVSDRTFLLHLGGKLEVTSKVPLRTRDDLSMAYTPGVARVCRAIASNPEDARKLTIKRNTVAVVTDGSAVLGLGNIGPAAAMPVMEGKAVLFKRFGGVDAWPVVLDTQDTEEIIRIVKLIAPAYGGINLEDIAAPRCFEVERRLREVLDIPVLD